jgi:hypothetical protein
MSRAQTAKKLRLARERHIMSERQVDIKQSIYQWLQQPKRAIFDEEGKPVSDSRKYVEVTEREVIPDGTDEDLWLTFANGAEYRIRVERRR